MTRATFLVCFAALSGFTTAGLAAPSGPPYTLTDLSTLGGQQSIATGINNSGLVVGTSNLYGDTIGNGYVFSYMGGQASNTGGQYYLGTNNGGTPVVALTGVFGLLDTAFGYTSQNSNARAIAENGDIVGYLGDHAAGFTTYISTGASGSMAGTEVDSVTDLGTLGGTFSAAFGVIGTPGGTDTVVGGSETGVLDALGYPLSQAFITSYNTYTPPGGINTEPPLIKAPTPPTGLGVLAPFDSSAAYGIGKSGGAIVGSSYYADPFITASVATLFSSSASPVSLGALPSSLSSDAYAADSTLAVGDSTTAAGVYHPVSFSLSPVGTVTDLGLLSGFSNGVAFGVNAANQIVGNAYNTDKYGNPTTFHGFLYSGGTLYDLNSLLSKASAGNTVEEAISINDYGQIAADGINVNGQMHAFLLSPTPVVTGLSPSSVPPGTNIVQLTVTGSNFAPNAIVYVDGAAVPTIFGPGNGSLTALVTLPPNSTGVTVDVGTPTPGGNGQVLAIGSASLAASVGSLTIDSVNQQYDLTVTLTNTGTVPASNVQFGTGTLAVYPGPTTTNYVSETTTGTGTVAPNGGTETWTLVFAKSALPSGTRSASAGVGGSFTYGASSGTFSASKSLRGITTLK